MYTVTRYVASDGSEWQTEDACRARDKMIYEVDVAMAALKPTPKDCGWEGYVQQSLADVLLCKTMLYEIANRDGVLKWAIDSQKRSRGRTDESLIRDAHPTWFNRMLDGDHRPLGQAYGRLCCIDGKCREWNQPYYAINPGTGEMVCVG